VYSKEMRNIAVCLNMFGREALFRQDCTGTSQECSAEIHVTIKNRLGLLLIF